MRSYYALSGILILFSAAAATYWVTTLADSGWFALQRLELPVGLRVIVLGTIVIGGGRLLWQHFLKPVFRPTNDSELALLLERRFPEFQDRLITAVEAEHGYSESGDLSQQMLEQTVSQAASVATKVSAGQVFDARLLKMRSWIAGAFFVSLIGSAVASPGALERWWNAFVRCDEVYHVRETHLEFTIIAQPGDRKVRFRETEAGPVYMHPLGADLELEVSVPVEHPRHGGACVVPERIQVDVIRMAGNPSRTFVESGGGRTFKFILTRLQESISLEVQGGDFRTPVPLRIEAVPPPGLDTIQADCVYPEYTGLNEQRESVVPVLSREVSLPVGTVFELSVTTNKPLQAARISTDAFDIDGDRFGSKLIPRGGYSGPTISGGPLIGEDGTTLSAMFRLAPGAAEESADGDDSSERSDGDTPGESSSGDGPSGDAGNNGGDAGNESGGSALPIASNSPIRFFFHDLDDIQSASPDVLRVRGIPDKPPVIAVKKFGVGKEITRRAIIPLRGVIQDDYGLKSAQFRFIVDNETQWRPRPFRNSFRPVLEYDMEAAGGPGSEYFRVEELELTEGQTLALTIVATDGCTIPEPNTSQSEPAVFRIVSAQDLLAALYARELNERGKFEAVIVELTRIEEDLAFHLDVAKRVDGAKPAEASADDRRALSTCAKNGGDSLRRQNNTLKSIIESFEEIRAELINNSIPPRKLADDMNENIIGPLAAIRVTQMDQADRSISRFRVAAAAGRPTTELITESKRDVSNAIARLRQILENVRDMAEFHELYQEGKYIYEDILRLWEETRELQKKRAIEKLKLLE